MSWNTLLDDKNLKNKFCQNVEERYKKTEKRKTLQKALVNSAQECIPKCGMTGKKKWMASEIFGANGKETQNEERHG